MARSVELFRCLWKDNTQVASRPRLSAYCAGFPAGSNMDTACHLIIRAKTPMKNAEASVYPPVNLQGSTQKHIRYHSWTCVDDQLSSDTENRFSAQGKRYKFCDLLFDNNFTSVQSLPLFSCLIFPLRLNQIMVQTIPCSAYPVDLDSHCPNQPICLDISNRRLSFVRNNLILWAKGHKRLS